MIDQNDGRDRGWLSKIMPGANRAADTGEEQSTIEAPNDQPDDVDRNDTEVGAQTESAQTRDAGDGPSGADAETSLSAAPPLNEGAAQNSPVGPSAGLSTTHTQAFSASNHWPEGAHVEVHLAAAASEPPSRGSEPTRVDTIDPPEEFQATVLPVTAEEDSVDETSPEADGGSVNGFDLDAYGLPMASTEPVNGHSATERPAADLPADEPPADEMPEVAPAPQAFVPEKELLPAAPVEESGEQDFRAPTAVDENSATDTPAADEPDAGFVPGAPFETRLDEARPEESAAEDDKQSSPRPLDVMETEGSEESVEAETTAPVPDEPVASAATSQPWPETSTAEPAAQDHESSPIDEGAPDEEPKDLEGPSENEVPANTVELSESPESDDPGSHEVIDDRENLEEVRAEEAEVATASSAPSIEALTSAEAVIPVDEVSPGDSATLTEEAQAPVSELSSESETPASPASEAHPSEDLTQPAEDAAAELNQKAEQTADETTQDVVEHQDAAAASAEEYSYLVSDARFEVAEGELRLKDGVNLDSDREPIIDVLVATIDAEGDSAAENYAVAVNDSGRTEPIPLNNPLVEPEPMEETEAAAMEERPSENSPAEGEDSPPVQSAERDQAESTVVTALETSAPMDATELETGEAVAEAASMQGRDEDAGSEAEETLSVQSIEETLSFGDGVEEPEARHDFLLLGSDEGESVDAQVEEPSEQPAKAADEPTDVADEPSEVSAESAAPDPDSPPEGPEEAPSLFGNEDRLPEQENQPLAAAEGEPAAPETSDEEGDGDDTESAEEDAEWNLFLFEPEAGRQEGDGPAAGEGKAETLDLSEVAESGRSWTILLNDGSEIKGTGEDYLDLTEDASGTITFDDGTEMTFDSVERVTW